MPTFDDPTLPRVRKCRGEDGNQSLTLKVYFRQNFSDYLDGIIQKVTDRFLESTAAQHKLNVEKFLLQDDDQSFSRDHFASLGKRGS